MGFGDQFDRDGGIRVGSLGAALVAALLNAAFGSLVAWVLVRYRFPGRRVLDALIDFPFALPTAVAGSDSWWIYSPNTAGLAGFWFRWGIEGAYTRLGVVLALTFVGLPFSVRTLQPMLENLDKGVEEAAAILGAGRMRTFVSVIAPTLLPTVLNGFGLAFARGLGEYGSIVFISGNLARTQIAPALVVARLEGHDYNGAVGVALVLMIFSFILLFTLNWLQGWSSRFQRP